MDKIPQSINKKEWETYLKRELNHEELLILKGVQYERIYNYQINNLYDILDKDNLTIKKLVDFDNSLFESLKVLKITDNIKYLKHGLLLFIYNFKNYKNLFNNETKSIEELFDIDFLENNNFAKNDKNTNQMILYTVSYIYKLKIIIYDILHKTKPQEIINMSKSEQIETIYLGKILEYYLPLNQKQNKKQKRINHSKGNELYECWLNYIKQEQYVKNLKEKHNYDSDISKTESDSSEESINEEKELLKEKFNLS